MTISTSRSMNKLQDAILKIQQTIAMTSAQINEQQNDIRDTLQKINPETEVEVDLTTFPIDYDTKLGFRLLIESPESKPQLSVYTGEGNWEQISLSLALGLANPLTPKYISQCLRLYNKVKLEHYRKTIEEYGLDLLEDPHYFPWNKEDRKESDLYMYACGYVLPKVRLFKDASYAPTSKWDSDVFLEYSGSYLDRHNSIVWQDRWELRFMHCVSEKYEDKVAYCAEGGDKEGFRNLLERLVDPDTFRLELALTIPDEAARWVKNEETYPLAKEIMHESTIQSFDEKVITEIVATTLKGFYTKLYPNGIALDKPIKHGTPYQIGQYLGQQIRPKNLRLAYLPEISYAYVPQASPWGFEIPASVGIDSPKKWVARDEQGGSYLAEEGTPEHTRLSGLWKKEVEYVFVNAGWHLSLLNNPLNQPPLNPNGTDLYLTVISDEHVLRLNKYIDEDNLDVIIGTGHAGQTSQENVLWASIESLFVGEKSEADKPLTVNQVAQSQSTRKAQTSKGLATLFRRK